MPLPIAFWEVASPTQVTFDQLPVGTEIPHPTTPGLWGPPKMTRRIRFPLSKSMDVFAAESAIGEAFRQGERTHFLAVIWKWTDGQLQLAFFRSKHRDVLALGETKPPDWFDANSVTALSKTIWERLMEDDDD